MGSKVLAGSVLRVLVVLSLVTVRMGVCLYESCLFRCAAHPAQSFTYCLFFRNGLLFALFATFPRAISSLV